MKTLEIIEDKMKKSTWFLILLLTILILPTKSWAADFDPSFLISDAEMKDYNSMTAADIKNFLTKRNGTLESYLTFDKDGNAKTAVQAFYEIAQNWQINPKYLLVLTQKEKSLLEDSTPTQKQYDWATGYGVCDSCGMDDPAIQRFKGFYRQVNSAAAQTAYYLTNIKEFNYQPSKTYAIDGQTVMLKNTATAGLYNYTPHIAGAKSFWTLWTKYFGKTWPDGSLLRADDGTDVYYIENGVKRLIASKAILASRFDAKKILTVSASDLNTYDDGPAIKYLNFALLKDSATGNLYMIVNDTKRKIVSQAVFTKLGFKEDEIIAVSSSDLALYKDGSDIAEYTAYPTGVLFQDVKAKKPFEKLFYVISGEKKPILTKEIFDANFSGLKITRVTAADLDNYLTGANVTLPDGWLVKTKKSSAVYVISHGQRLPIVSGAVFSSLGYNSKNIKTITDETMNLLEIGATLAGN